MALVTAPLKVGFIPEHFSTPLAYALDLFQANIDLVPFPSGTGHLVTSLRSREIDVAIGLTEGFVAALGSKSAPDGSIQKEGGYRLVGTYVETPLCWAISTGANRDDIQGVKDLRHKKLGVSRLGSGSHIMSSVLADQQGWLTPNPTLMPPFSVHPLQNFASLRAGVNSGVADFFMWETFTSSRYFVSKSRMAANSASVTDPSSRPSTSSARDSPAPPVDLIKRIGEIYTPWPSWMIVSRHATDARLPFFFAALDRGIKHFEENPQDAVRYISTNLDYTAEDAQAWLKTVRFAQGGVQGVRRDVVGGTISSLIKAGVLVDTQHKDAEIDSMIGFERED